MQPGVRAQPKENPFATGLVSSPQGRRVDPRGCRLAARARKRARAHPGAGDALRFAVRSESDATPKPKRRRGNRGGRRRKKPGESAAAGADGAAAEAAPAAKKTEREKSTRERPERKEQSQRAQRRQNQRKESGSARRRPPRRAPLPKAKRELIVSVDAGEKRVAVLEDGRVAEVYLERPEKRSIAGNIYKGVVDNVLPGMEAAFVEIGLEKNGFLYVDEIVGPELEGRKGARKIQDLISKGQEILVQAVKDPDEDEGRPPDDRDLAARPLRRLPAARRGPRRLAPARRRRAHAPEGDPEGDRAQEGRRDRAHRRRGRLRRGRRARPRVPRAPLEDDRDPGEGRQAAEPRLPGGRAAAARHARPLHRRLRAGLRRPRPHLQADRRLPEEDLAAHGRAGRPLQGAASR